MAGAWQALRELDRELALALLFAPSQHRETLANLATLACEAENAVVAASEPMLAAIRLQWWVEALESGNSKGVPLVMRLLAEIDSATVTKQALIDLLGLWQDSLTSNPDDRFSCWNGLFTLMTSIVADQGDDPLQDVITHMTHAQISDHSHLTDEDLIHLDRHSYRWLMILALTALHRQQGGNMASPMLIWRMLGWRYGIARPKAV